MKDLKKRRVKRRMNWFIVLSSKTKGSWRGRSSSDDYVGSGEENCGGEEEGEEEEGHQAETVHHLGRWCGGGGTMGHLIALHQPKNEIDL